MNNPVAEKRIVNRLLKCYFFHKKLVDSKISIIFAP